MQIQLSTDNNLRGGEELFERFKAELQSKLARFSEHLTRLDVHLSDQMGRGTDGEDLRCVIQAYPAGRKSVAVTNDAGSVAEAFTGAVHKIERVLETLFGRAGHHKGGETIRHMTEEESS